MNHRFDMALRLAKEGRTEGFLFLYENTCRMQICQAMNITGDLQQAQYAVQQAYQQVFDGIQNVTQAEMFESWLCDMVTYFAIAAVREQSQSLFHESEDMTFTLSDDDEDVVITEPVGIDEISAAFSPEDVNSIATMLLSELTEEEKICVLMHYQNNRSAEQIAQTIGCSENAANFFISSGKKKILEHTKLMQESDARIKWKAIPFLLSILQIQASNLIASGCIGTAATFQIAGASVAMGAPAVAVGTSAGMSMAGSLAMETGVAGSSAMGSGVAGGAAGTVSAGSALGHGFLGTLGGKITAGIVAAAVVGSAAGGIIYYNAKKEDASKSTEITTEIAEEMTEEKTTEPTTTEEATTEQQVDETYKRIYLSVLKDHETTIRRYNQHRYAVDGSGQEQSPAPIAVQDIVGDETPELLFLEDTIDDGMVEGDLCIYTIENGKAKEIYSMSQFDQQIAGSGMRYYLYQLKDDNKMYAFKKSGDETVTSSVQCLESGIDGTYAFHEIMKQSVGPNDDYTGTDTQSVIDGEIVSEDVYAQKINEIAGNFGTLLMYNYTPNNEIGKAMAHAQQGYLSYDEAIAFLGGGEPVQETQENQASALPFSDGTWHTRIR